MVPSAFDEENTVLDTPEGINPDTVAPLSVYRGPNPDGLLMVTSCWKFTTEELVEMQRTGRVWLMVLGDTMAPVHLTGFSPFMSQEDYDKRGK